MGADGPTFRGPFFAYVRGWGGTAYSDACCAHLRFHVSQRRADAHLELRPVRTHQREVREVQIRDRGEYLRRKPWRRMANG